MAERTFYLPHFAVVNPNKEGIRVVFDAAAEYEGCSLNKQLITGPDLNKPLISVLLRFREAPIAVVADIREMFLQVAVRQEDQDSQRFLWRDKDGLSSYVMTRMVFGAKCSPTLAQFVKNLNAKKYKDRWPRAVEAILERHYVDDLVDCFMDENQAIEVVKQVIAIHDGGGFELRNFASNSKKVLQTLNGCNNDSNIVSMNGRQIERVLGMHWNCEEDKFMFVFRFHKIRADILELRSKPTKREVLSTVMSVFDPFGLLANFMLMGKLLLQRLWALGIGWDEQLPDEQFEIWKAWVKTLADAQQVKVPRCYTQGIASVSDIQLHIFADASECAVAAIAYLRIVADREVTVNFVLAKTRCAPLKYTSIPRLELQAAVVAVRVKDVIMENIGLQVNNVHYWTDSATVLSWIRSDSRRYKQYVANRLGEIHESSRVCEWKWVPSAHNAADDGTRVRRDFEPNNRWIKGPDFLKGEEQTWPSQPGRFAEDKEAAVERKAQEYILMAEQYDCIINYSRFSQYSRLNRTMAWVIRFVTNCKAKLKLCQPSTGWLKAEEMALAVNRLCELVQKESFGAEYSCLRLGDQINKRSPLLPLNPQLDETGLMRLMGRLENATCMSAEEKRPIILPKDHKLTRLIVEHIHVKFRHQNRNTIISEIRRKFWVPSLRVLLKKVESMCNFCKIRRAKPQPPIMGLLPIDRLTPFVRPFSYSGVDFFGPMLVSVRRQKEKRWVALFTCLTTRAVHLELVADLSSDACLLAIRNFVNRRGIPVQMRSDNGTNFVGLKKELAGVRDFVDYGAIGEGVSNLGIRWKFNCPSNPSEGGAWERLVQSVKKVLIVVLQECAPRIETLISVLIEAENIVNSRPLTHLPVSCEEEEPLTPNHFLLHSANSTQTPSTCLESSFCLRKQWRIAQSLKNCFWKRWLREYLPELTRCTKWCQPTPSLLEGDLVLVCDAALPRSEWKRGRIAKLISGHDGVARTAEVKTAQTMLKRPISKLAKLDLMTTDGED